MTGTTGWTSLLTRIFTANISYWLLSSSLSKLQNHVLGIMLEFKVMLWWWFWATFAGRLGTPALGLPIVFAHYFIFLDQRVHKAANIRLSKC